MTEAQKLDLKDKIQKKINEMEDEIIRLEDMTQPISPENSLGRVSRMDAINNKSVAEASLRSVRRRLEKLRDAITKIDEKGFGDCVRCKKPIPMARLMFMPESTKCVRCAEGR